MPSVINAIAIPPFGNRLSFQKNRVVRAKLTPCFTCRGRRAVCLPVPLPAVKLLKRCQEEQEEEREACECQGFSPILSSSFFKRASHSLQSVLERLPKNLMSPLFIFWVCFWESVEQGIFFCLFVCLGSIRAQVRKQLVVVFAPETMHVISDRKQKPQEKV